jgi:hypothetical protein
MKAARLRIVLAAALLWLVMPEAVLADNCGSLSDCFHTLRAALAAVAGAGLFAVLLSIGLDLLPGVGTLKGIIEAFTGRDLVTGDELEWWERILGIVPVAGVFTGAGRGAAKAIDATEGARNVIRAAKTARDADNITDVVRTADRVDDVADATRNVDRADDAADASRAADRAGDAVDAARTGDRADDTADAARRAFARVRDGYASRLGVGSGGQVHHAIELQALDRYPGVFRASELNDFGNMRGIATELANRRQLHNSKIREMWDRHYRQLDQEIIQRGLQPGTQPYNDFVRRYMEDARDEIDYILRQFFTEYRSGLNWQRTRS